jgi:hypothetical protein
MATLNAVLSGGPFTYQWYKNGVPYANTESITVNEGGEYAVTATDGGSGSCTSPAAKITLSNTSSAMPTVTLIRSAENPTQGDEVTYTATINFTPATQYTWTITNGTLKSGGGNTANAVVKFENTGAASVKVEVSNVCGPGEATHSITVNPGCADPVTVSPSTATNKTAIVTEQITLGPVSATFSQGSPSAVYQWYSNATALTTGGSSITGATNNTYTPPAYTATGTYYYYCVVKNSCQLPSDAGVSSGLYTVTVNPNPAGNPIGTGTFSGKTCFDVVETNEGGNCATLASRASQKAYFTQTATNTQTYTFTTNGSVSKIRFYAVDQSGLVIESITPGNASWETAANLSGTYTVTVKYKTGLNSPSSQNGAGGLDRDNALNAMLYVVYNDNPGGTGSDKRLELKISVQDCTCCPGYLALGGEYTQKTGGYLTQFSDGANFTTVSNYFTATGKDVCFYKTDAKNSTTITWNAATNGCNTDVTYVDASYQSMGGWRLPTLAELGAIQSIHAALATQPTSASGTANLRTGYYWSSSERSSTLAWGWDFNTSYAYWNYKTIVSYVRCVRSF